MKLNYWTYSIQEDPYGINLQVVITPIWYWLTEKTYAEEFTSEEWADLLPTIDKLGLNQLTELNSTTFEADGYTDCDTVILEDELIKEGFITIDAFEDYMNEYN
jgi:hypothetical protein